MLLRNILSVIKYSGTENTEKPGSSNLNCLTVLAKITMPTKEPQDSELDQMSKTLKHSESEPTPILEIIHQLQFIQVSLCQTLQEYSSLTPSPSSFIVAQTQGNAVTLSPTSSTTSVVPSATVTEVNMFVLTLMGNIP